jgi:hypothetical protein
MELPIKFEDVANEENEQEINSNQSKDENSEWESDSDAAHALEVNKY